MDERFVDTCIFDIRKREWNKEKIKNDIDQIFKTVELMPNWTYHGSEWTTPVISKKSKEELKQSVYSILKAKITNPNAKEYEYRLQIPDLIQEQFFFIGGNYKVPIFQLFDMPVLFRNKSKDVRKTSMKLRNNALTISFDVDIDKDNQPQYMLRLFNKRIPFEILFSAMHTEEEFEKYFDDNSSIPKDLLVRIKDEWDLNLDEEEKINRVGEYFMTKPADRYKKGENVLFSLKVAYEVDHFSSRFFKTNSILMEILYHYQNFWYLQGKGYDDRDLQNKRLRLSEYILSDLVRIVYELMVSVHKNHKDKFQIPQNIILDSCNTSSGERKNDIANIIHYNFPINPVSEIASLIQTSVVGPGGFKKDNVPPHLRDLHDSQIGILCPADTPDRDGCGVVNNLVPVVKLNDDLTFNFDETNTDLVTSYPISLVPFLENDDATRLQMASNQMKQTIWVRDSQKPIVRSGLEDAYLDRTTFYHKAKAGGVVVYKDEEYMLVVYDTLDPAEVELFNINYRSLNMNVMDYTHTKYNEGDRFKEGDVLCNSDFIKDNEIALGQNLLTAVMIWKGFNYEDGIVISDKVVNKMKSVHHVDLSYHIESGQALLSLEDGKYKPFPEIGQKIKKGQAYAKIKNLDYESAVENVNEDAIEQTADEHCEVIRIKIYPNAWNKQVREFHNDIMFFINNQLTRYNLIVNSLTPYMDDDEIAKFTKRNNISNLNCNDKNIGKYTKKSQKIGGVLVQVDGIYEQAIGVGDKVANRHGNKGVIAKIVPEEEMPVLEDGRRPEIIINPLGIISRMNVGQLFELHMSEAVHQLKQRLKENFNVTGSSESKKEFDAACEFVKKFYMIIDKSPKHTNTKRVLKEFAKVYKRTGDFELATETLYVIAPPFQSPTPEELDEAMKFVGAEYKMSLYDPETDLHIREKVACGYMYFEKLIHRASDKMAARSIGPYSRKTSQPMSGKANLGGHRLGEMEVWALLAHDAKVFLKDLLTVHSDSIGKKHKVLAKILQNPALAESEEVDDRPQSLRVLEAYLNAIGLNMSFNDDDNNGYLFDENINRKDSDNE